MNNFASGGSDKWLTADQLRKVIKQIPANAILLPNAVGNLAVMSPNREFLGFVDFLHDGEYVRADNGN